MKKINILVLTVFVTLFCLTGCTDITQPEISGNLPAPAPGKGYVKLEFSSALSRTLLPSTYTFTGYTLIFTPENPINYREKAEFSDHQDVYELEAGNWSLSVEVFSDAAKDHKVASSAAPVTFSIIPGSNVPKEIKVPLVFINLSGSGNGTFSWAISHEAGNDPDQIEVLLERLDAAQTPGYWYYSTGAESFPAGFYLATVRFEVDKIKPLVSTPDNPTGSNSVTGAKRAVFSDIVHIYPGQTTHLEKSFAKNELFYGIKDIWLFGHMTGWALGDLTDKDMEPQEDGTFVWEGDVSTTDRYFRFSLTDTSGWTPATDDNRKGGAWFVPESDGAAAVIGSAGNSMTLLKLHHENPSAVEKAWRFAEAGWYIITVDPFEYKFYAEKPEKDIKISVNGQNSVKKGSTGDFTAVITEGKNYPAVPVFTWTIDSPSSAGTSINQSGVLTVAAGETNDHITIKAAYKTWSGTKSVEISDAAPLPKPAAPTLSNAGLAEWSAIVNASGYSLVLYKGSAEVFDEPILINNGTAVSYNFLSEMRKGAGIYSFTVTAVGDGDNYSTSETSEHSNTVEMLKLAAPQYTWWDGDIVKWNHTTGYDNTDSYSVRLYKGETALGTEPLVVAKNTGKPGEHGGFDFSCDLAELITEEGDYTAKITAVGINRYISSDEAEEEVHIAKPAAPSGLWWDGNVARWGEVASAASYTVQLYKDSVTVGSPQSTDTNSFSFTSLFTATGKYTFKVRANRGNAVSSNESELSYVKVHLNLNIVTNGGATFGSTKVNNIAYGDGVYVAVGVNGRIMRSANGTDWSLAKENPAGSIELFSVAWGGTPGKVFAAVGAKGRIYTSEDGDEWAAASGNPLWEADSLTLRSVIWTGSYFVAGGHVDYGYYNKNGAHMVRSSDGINWTRTLNLQVFDDSIFGLAHNGNYVMSVGNGGRVTYTTNITDQWNENPGSDLWADKWSYMTHYVLKENQNDPRVTAFNAAYGNGTWVVVGGDGRISWTRTPSPGREDWNVLAGNFTHFGTRNIYSVTFGNGIFVAVGDNGCISVSPDGETWAAIPPGTGAGQTRFGDREGINTVTFDGTNFIFGGQNYDNSASKIVISE